MQLEAVAKVNEKDRKKKKETRERNAIEEEGIRGFV